MRLETPAEVRRAAHLQRFLRRPFLAAFAALVKGNPAGWHDDVICEHLEAIGRGLPMLINVPPGALKRPAPIECPTCGGVGTCHPGFFCWMG